jgi:hypothetical protein
MTFLINSGAFFLGFSVFVLLRQKPDHHHDKGNVGKKEIMSKIRCVLDVLLILLFLAILKIASMTPWWLCSIDAQETAL